MKLGILFIISLVSWAAPYSAVAEEGREEYLHNIYRKYHSSPTSQELWDKALAKRASQEYTVMKGDTLWDISRVLFGDGFFWSKVWSLNPFITNPHQISVNQVIHFYQGSGLDAPGLELKSLSNIPALAPTTQLVNTTWWKSPAVQPPPLDLTDVVIPPSTRVYPKALDSFPPSLPNWYFQTDSEKKKQLIEILPINRKIVESVLKLPFYISDQDQNVKGRVKEIEKNARTASERDVIFIDADEDLTVGTTYTVLDSNGKIRDPDAVFDFPRSYVVQGEVEIISEVEGYYKAMVTSALFPIEIGAMIVPGPNPTMNLTQPGEYAAIKAMIVGGENDTTRSIFGPQSVVYLNRGSEDGLKLNQRAPIMALHRTRNADSRIYSNTWKVGELKIVKVDPNYSTAIVMEALDGIMPGDLVGEVNKSDITTNVKKIDSSTDFGFNDDAMMRRQEKSFKDLMGEEEEAFQGGAPGEDLDMGAEPSKSEESSGGSPGTERLDDESDLDLGGGQQEAIKKDEKDLLDEPIQEEGSELGEDDF